MTLGLRRSRGGQVRPPRVAVTIADRRKSPPAAMSRCRLPWTTLATVGVQARGNDGDRGREPACGAACGRLRRPPPAAGPWRPLPCGRLFAGSSRNLPPATPIPCPAAAPRRCGPFFRRCGRPRRRQGAAAAAPRCYGPFFRAAARPACGWAPALCQPPSYTSCAGAAPAIAPCTPPLPPAARPAAPIGRPRPRPRRRRLGLPPPPVDGGCLPPRPCPGQPAPGTPRIAPSAPRRGGIRPRSAARAQIFIY